MILAELAVPGMISVFLGAAALLTGLLISAGFIGSWMGAIITWMVLSILLIATLRASVLKLFPGETSKGSVDADGDARGTLVTALSDITSEPIGGQIDFRDAVWQASCQDGLIKQGATVRLVRRNGLVWTVEPVSRD